MDQHCIDGLIVFFDLNTMGVETSYLHLYQKYNIKSIFLKWQYKFA